MTIFDKIATFLVFVALVAIFGYALRSNAHNRNTGGRGEA
jgi:hypothetical protein